MRRWKWLWFLPFLMGCCITQEHANPASASNTSADFLIDTQYKNIIVEITPVTGCEPNAEAVAFLCRKINQYCHKDSVVAIINPAVSITPTKLPPSSDPIALASATGIWTESSLRQFESEHFHFKTSGDTIVLHIAYVPGTYHPTPPGRTYVGMAFHYDLVAVFKSLLESDCERSTLLHEFGHILGLVNNNTKMVTEHEDHEHETHCGTDCVMYWRVSRESNPDFDEHCKEDIKAAGGK